MSREWRRTTTNNVRWSTAFDHPVRLPRSRTKRSTGDVQNSEGRIQGAGWEENGASKSRCIMHRGNKHRGARSLFQLVDVSAVRSTCTSAADAAVFRVQIETATIAVHVFSLGPKATHCSTLKFNRRWRGRRTVVDIEFEEKLRSFVEYLTINTVPCLKSTDYFSYFEILQGRIKFGV